MSGQGDCTVADDQIKRLQRDLSTMRQAIRLDKPYDEGDIRCMLLLGLGALIAVPILEFSLWDQRLVLVLATTPGLVGYTRRYFVARRNQSNRRSLWTEYRLSAIGAVCIGVATVAWIWWSRQFGATRETAGAGIMYCLGFAGLAIGALDKDRRVYLLGGLGLIPFAMAVPWLEPRRIATFGAALIAILLPLAAAMIWWQIRRETDDTDRPETRQ